MLKKLKRYISILLTAAMVMMLTPVGGINVSAETSGTGWSFDETTGTLTITADNGTTAWRSSCDKKLVQSVKIQEGVNSIGGSAFSGCTALVSIEIPDSVKSIGSQAFTSCYKLKSVKIPNGVTSIGLMAFWDCLDLASIEIPNSVTSINNFAFVGCRSLTSIEIPNSVTSIGWSAFLDCKGFTSIEIPDSVESIGGAAFEGCSSLETITIPDSVVSIGNQALKDCSSLTSIVIPDSVTSVGSDVFMGCSSLENITYPSGLDASGASVPDTAVQIEYTDNNGEVTITGIILPEGKEPIEIPSTIGGKEVTKVDENIRDKVSSSGHTHQNEQEATCKKQAVCKICGSYGELAAHTPDSGTVTKQPTAAEAGVKTFKCTVCGEVTKTETVPALGGGSITPSDPSNPTDPSKPASPLTPVRPVASSQPDNGAPFIKSESGKSGWDAIKSEAENAGEDGVITVDMNGAAVVPESIFDTLKGKDLTLVFDMGGGVAWSVNGRDITSDINAGIDFSVKANTENIPIDVVNNITGERYSLQISLAHNGKFGFKAVLSINLGSNNAGRNAALYYYNNGNLRLMCESEISADGTAKLPFTHASDYLIVIEEKSSGNAENPNDGGETGKSDTQDSNPKTGDTREPWKTVLLGFTAAAIGVLLPRRNKIQAK